MSIALTGTGGLFVRWGAEIAGVNETATALQTTLGTRVTTINDEYLAAQQDVVSGLYAARDSARQSMSSWLGNLQTEMQDTIIQMAYDDGTGINPVDLTTALEKLIAQMVADVDSIQRPTISATVTAGSLNHGNGTMIVSLVDPLDGNPTDMVFAETLTATCTNDSFNGNSATEGQEPFTIVGQVAAASDLAVDWPLGSGASVQTTTSDPSATGNIITDGDFEAWTSNTPDNWSMVVGTPGTTLVKGTSPYTGSYDLEFIGNGSQLTCVRQSLTLTDFLPNRSYGFTIRAKTDGSVAAGVLRVALIDQSNAVTTDQLGTANSVSTNISTLTSSYTVISGFFRMPTIMTMTELKIEIALTTAMTNTEVLHMDSCGLVEATQFYAGGPLSATFRGSTPFAINDKFTVAIATNAGVTSFCRSLDRLLGLRNLGLKIPSASSPTISNALIA